MVEKLVDVKADLWGSRMVVHSAAAMVVQWAVHSAEW